MVARGRRKVPIAPIDTHAHPPPQPENQAPRRQRFRRGNKPPKHPTLETRDDVVGQFQGWGKREPDENAGYSSDGSAMTLSGPYRNCDPATVSVVSIKQGLKAQKEKLGIYHPSITRTLHSLALEYKVRGKFDKAVIMLKEGLNLLDERLAYEKNQADGEDDVSLDSRASHASTYKIPKANIKYMLEEKSVLYSCLGTIYRLRRLYNESIDYYIKSCDMLVDAEYTGECHRVKMMVRILKRTEAESRRKKGRRNVGTVTRLSARELGIA
jgi:tetratricopeptide (TPR) repeat protein